MIKCKNTDFYIEVRKTILGQQQVHLYHDKKQINSFPCYQPAEVSEVVRRLSYAGNPKQEAQKIEQEYYERISARPNIRGSGRSGSKDEAVFC